MDACMNHEWVTLKQWNQSHNLKLKTTLNGLNVKNMKVWIM